MAVVITLYNGNCHKNFYSLLFRLRKCYDIFFSNHDSGTNCGIPTYKDGNHMKPIKYCHDNTKCFFYST